MAMKAKTNEHHYIGRTKKANQKVKSLFLYPRVKFTKKHRASKLNDLFKRKNEQKALELEKNMTLAPIREICRGMFVG